MTLQSDLDHARLHVKWEKDAAAIGRAQQRIEYLETIERAFNAWLDKTEWVQQQKMGLPGQHRMDVINQLITSIVEVRDDLVWMASLGVSCDRSSKDYDAAFAVMDRLPKLPLVKEPK